MNPLIFQSSYEFVQFFLRFSKFFSKFWEKNETKRNKNYSLEFFSKTVFSKMEENPEKKFKCSIYEFRKVYKFIWCKKEIISVHLMDIFFFQFVNSLWQLLLCLINVLNILNIVDFFQLFIPLWSIPNFTFSYQNTGLKTEEYIRVAVGTVYWGLRLVELSKIA